MTNQRFLLGKKAPILRKKTRYFEDVEKSDDDGFNWDLLGICTILFGVVLQLINFLLGETFLVAMLLCIFYLILEGQE